MAYCTIDKLKQALPAENIVQLTDDENTGEIDEEKVEEAIAFSDSRRALRCYYSGCHPRTLRRSIAARNISLR